MIQRLSDSEALLDEHGRRHCRGTESSDEHGPSDEHGLPGSTPQYPAVPPAVPGSAVGRAHVLTDSLQKPAGGTAAGGSVTSYRQFH